MYSELYQYLVLYKKLNLPGIGVFVAERKPAETDVAARQVLAPFYQVVLHKDDEVHPSKKMFGWLAGKWSVSELDAVKRFNNFVYDLKHQLSTGAILQWDQLGKLSKNLSGEIVFEPEQNEKERAAVPAVKVLREKAAHTLTVGEYERTSEEMRELLVHEKKKSSFAWLAALILVIISVIFIGYYFSTHGLSVPATGNQQKADVRGQ